MKIELTVSDLACEACVDSVTKAIHGIDATAQVTADPATKQVEIETTTSESEIREAIAGAGYTIA